jgi:hypothetical protein
MTWWTLKALPWLKKYWKWLLFPIGILIFIAGYVVRPKPKVLSSELHGAGDTKREADDKAAEKTDEARAKRDERLAEVEKDHAKTVAKLTRKQRDQLEELREDPDKVNDFLLQVGREIRGEK